MFDKHKILSFFLWTLVCLFIFGFFINSIKLLQENYALKIVGEKYSIDYGDLHNSINKFRDEIWNNFISVPQPGLQSDLWYDDRGILRHSALDILSGDRALCGDFSRVMVRLLNHKGIKARRVYLSRDWATNHVLFEYYHPQEKKWYIVDSYYLDGGVIHKITSEQKISAYDLVNDYSFEVIYDKYSYVGKQISYKLNYFGKSIPFFVSILMDNIYLLKMLFYFVGIGSFSLCLKFANKYIKK